jgi:hypothetical protein
MIKPELAFVIFVASNFAAPLLAFIAGRRWPHRRMAFHFLAVIWIVLSVYVCHKVTFTPDRAAVDDSYEPEEVIQFLVVGAVFFAANDHSGGLSRSRDLPHSQEAARGKSGSKSLRVMIGEAREMAETARQARSPHMDYCCRGARM